MISLGNGTECIMFEKGEPLCTIGCSSAAERAWRGGAGPSTHLHKSFYNQFTQVQIPAAWEEKHIIRLCLIQYTLNFPDRFKFLEVKLNNWQRPSVSEKCGKTSQTNLCSNEDVLGGACWSLAGGTLWQSENSVKTTQGIHTQEIPIKRHLIFLQASVGVSQILIAPFSYLGYSSVGISSSILRLFRFFALTAPFGRPCKYVISFNS